MSLSLEDRIQLEERAKKRAYEQARNEAGPLQSAGADIGRGEVGMAVADATMAPDHRRWLEQIRDSYRAQAEEVQALLDILPNKIPDAVAMAIQRLIFRTK